MAEKQAHLRVYGLDERFHAFQRCAACRKQGVPTLALGRQRLGELGKIFAQTGLASQEEESRRARWYLRIYSGSKVEMHTKTHTNMRKKEARRKQPCVLQYKGFKKRFGT